MGLAHSARLALAGGSEDWVDLLGVATRRPLCNMSSRSGCLATASEMPVAAITTRSAWQFGCSGRFRFALVDSDFKWRKMADPP